MVARPQYRNDNIYTCILLTDDDTTSHSVPGLAPGPLLRYSLAFLSARGPSRPLLALADQWPWHGSLFARQRLITASTCVRGVASRYTTPKVTPARHRHGRGSRGMGVICVRVMYVVPCDQQLRSQSCIRMNPFLSVSMSKTCLTTDFLTCLDRSTSWDTEALTRPPRHNLILPHSLPHTPSPPPRCPPSPPPQQPSCSPSYPA